MSKRKTNCIFLLTVLLVIGLLAVACLADNTSNTEIPVTQLNQIEVNGNEGLNCEPEKESQECDIIKTDEPEEICERDEYIRSMGRIYCINEDFEDHFVIFTVNRAATFSFREYTVEDFPELALENVIELTYYMSQLVQMQIEAERTKDWSALEGHIKNNMLLNLNTFRRQFLFVLIEPGKEAVLKAIDVLRERPDVISASPDARRYFLPN